MKNYKEQYQKYLKREVDFSTSKMMNDIINKVNRKQFKDDDLWNKIFRLMSKFEQDIEYEFRKKFSTTVEYSFIMKNMRKALDEIGKEIYEKGIYKSSK